MRFVPYLYDKDKQQISVKIEPMTLADAVQTVREPRWQTDWTSDYLHSDRFDCYAVRRKDELIALGAYEIQTEYLVVHIVYMEAEPNSNPTITFPAAERMYHGIGSLLVAYGIKLSIDNGFGGDVVLRAKTTELEEHYIHDFGAVRLPSVDSFAPRLLIADEAAKQLFFRYLK